MERREGGDLFRDSLARFHDLAGSIGGDVVVERGEFRIEKGDTVAKIRMDGLGKISFEIKKGDRVVMENGNVDLETAYEGIHSHLVGDIKLESLGDKKIPLHERSMEIIKTGSLLDEDQEAA